MRIRALVSFSGALSMGQGQETECTDKVILKDLMKAKYIEEVKEKPNKEEELKKEIESLRKELEDLKKVPEVALDAIVLPIEDTQELLQEKVPEDIKKTKKDVKSEDESK
jgi:Zn-dependent M32 family carboxypeptidase